MGSNSVIRVVYSDIIFQGLFALFSGAGMSFLFDKIRLFMLKSDLAIFKKSKIFLDLNWLQISINLLWKYRLIILSCLTEMHKNLILEKETSRRVEENYKIDEIDPGSNGMTL